MLVLMILGAASAAQAAETLLAPAPDTSGITAFGGEVVLSQRDAATGRWALVRLRNGALERLPVAERSVPFDADLGPDAAGRPMVVYSRCTQEPNVTSGLAPTPDWQTARGCDIYKLPLTGDIRERKLVAASSTGKSETTPSTWRGALAFVRFREGVQVPTIAYLPAGASRARHLGGGSVQVCHECKAGGSHDSVDQLDLGPSRVAYAWRMTGGFVYGVGIAWELRSAALAGGPSVLLDSGLISGTCGFRLPSAPSASANPIGYLDAGGECETTATWFATADPVTGALAAATTAGGLAAGSARDGDTIYWLRVTKDLAHTRVPGAGSCTAASGCELVASPAPADVASSPRPRFPPADIDVVRSDIGYRWVTGPAGVRVLAPPARVPCAPSASSAAVYVSAQWRRGTHTVRVLRLDPGGATRQVGSVQKRSLAAGVYVAAPRLLRCGDRTRLTYEVTTGGHTQRISVAVARASLGRRAR
jgi:hypothetical protein